SCRFDILVRPGPEGERALERLWASLEDETNVARWILRDVPEGGHGERLASMARRLGHRVGNWASISSPYVELASCQGQTSALEARLSSKLKANLRRRWKNLAARGRLEVVRHPGLDSS